MILIVILPQKTMTNLKPFYRNIVDQAGPGTWDMYVDASDSKTNVVIYCRDKTSETIKIST